MLPEEHELLLAILHIGFGHRATPRALVECRGVTLVLAVDAFQLRLILLQLLRQLSSDLERSYAQVAMLLESVLQALVVLVDFLQQLVGGEVEDSALETEHVVTKISGEFGPGTSVCFSIVGRLEEAFPAVLLEAAHVARLASSVDGLVGLDLVTTVDHEDAAEKIEVLAHLVVGLGFEDLCAHGGVGIVFRIFASQETVAPEREIVFDCPTFARLHCSNAYGNPWVLPILWIVGNTCDLSLLLLIVVGYQARHQGGRVTRIVWHGWDS